MIAMVTGAIRGIGYETVLALARSGARVVMVCRDRARGVEALERVRGRPGELAMDRQRPPMCSRVVTGHRPKALFERPPSLPVVRQLPMRCSYAFRTPASRWIVTPTSAVHRRFRSHVLRLDDPGAPTRLDADVRGARHQHAVGLRALDQPTQRSVGRWLIAVIVSLKWV